MLGIILVLVIVPPHDHVAGLKPVGIDDVDPLIILYSALAVGLKVGELILRGCNALILQQRIRDGRLDARKTRSVKSVSVRICSA